MTSYDPNSPSAFLFDLDDFDRMSGTPTDAAVHSRAQNNSIHTTTRNVKDEPDLTIPLGNSGSPWDHPAAAPMTSPGSSSSMPGFTSPPFPAYADALTTSPPFPTWADFSPTLDFDAPLAAGNGYGAGVGTVNPAQLFADPNAELYFSNANSSIPWSRWTEFPSNDVDREHTDGEMPQTPVDAFPIGNNLGLFAGPDGAFHQQTAQKMDLLHPFTSMALDSPPLNGSMHLFPGQAYPSNTASESQGHAPALFFNPGDPSAPNGVGLGVGLGTAFSNDHHTHHRESRPAPVPIQRAGLAGIGNQDVVASNSLPNLSTLASVTASAREGAGRPTSSRSGLRLSPPAMGIRSRLRAQSDASHPDHIQHRDRQLSTTPQPHSQKYASRRSGGTNGSGSEASPLKPPKQSLSTWQIFFTDWIARQDANGGRKLNVAQAAKEAGKEYKLLSDKDKEPYARRAAEARAQRQEELSSWHATLTPSLIALENRYRTAQRKAGLSRRSNLKDPNAPKKPLSAYFMFLKAVREDDAWATRVFEGEKETTRQSVLAAAKWREMSDDEKRPFLARAEHEKLEYEAARKEYEDAYAFGHHGHRSAHLVSAATGAGPGAGDFNSHGMDITGSGRLSSSATSQSPEQRRPRANSTGSTAMAFRLDDMLAPPLSSSFPNNSQPSMGMSGMGYFSTSPHMSSHNSIPIHIPKVRSRADSTPSPTSNSGSVFSDSP